MPRPAPGCPRAVPDHAGTATAAPGQPAGRAEPGPPTGQTQVSSHIRARQSSIGMAVPVWIGQK
ncbi:hypothetical protein GCM10010421_28980 [Streptomyces glaucus]|uniref:Secreted protein n=1 Tax=Streptomyces glaucus TaxID=284029 RepID=A0ABN3JQF9_9ACTN